MHSFHAAGTPRMGNPVREKVFRGCALHRQSEGRKGLFGKPSLPQKLFHYFSFAPQHFLYFLPLPQGQGSLRPGLFSALA